MMEPIWIDQPDALSQIETRSAGDAVLAEIAKTMINDGFVVLPNVIAKSDCLQIVRDHAVFTESFGSEISQHLDAAGRLLRVVNLHLSSNTAAGVATSERIMKVLDFLFGEEASVYSSLYFEYGSQQPIHRDSPFFETFPRDFFFGVWVALEDINPDAGPLMYVKGGHRFECDPHSIYDDVARKMSGSTAEAIINESLEQYYGAVIRTAAEFGEPRRAALRQGDIAIWHPRLPHGGSVAEDPSLTRRSMVFHCSPASMQVYQHDVFFAHRGPTPPPSRYGFTEQSGRQVALSGPTCFQH